VGAQELDMSGRPALDPRESRSPAALSLSHSLCLPRTGDGNKVPLFLQLAHLPHSLIIDLSNSTCGSSPPPHQAHAPAAAARPLGGPGPPFQIQQVNGGPAVAWLKSRPSPLPPRPRRGLPDSNNAQDGKLESTRASLTNDGLGTKAPVSSNIGRCACLPACLPSPRAHYRVRF